MTRGISYIRRAKCFARDQAGATAILFAVSATGLVGMLGASVDVGNALVAKNQLNNRVQAEALVGARALSTPNATSSSVGATVASWNGQKPLTSVAVTNTSTTLTCISATSNLPTCNGANPNGVKVTQTGKVSTYFLKMFGFPTFTLTSSATAAAAAEPGRRCSSCLCWIPPRPWAMPIRPAACRVSRIPPATNARRIPFNRS